MPAYIIEWTRAATKGLEALSKPDRLRILAAVDDLAENPRGSNVKTLQGDDRLLRRRVGDNRIIFMIEDARLVVVIVRVANRREVYR